MRTRALVMILIIAIGTGLIFAGLAMPAAAIDHSDLVFDCAAEPNEDFDAPPEGNATIGWFNGYWYDEPLDIDIEDGVTEDELAQISARAAARLEAMRCLPFQEMPPIDIIDRATFAEEQAEQFERWDENSRLFDNQQFETLLTIGSDTDSIEVRQESSAGMVGGYYNFVENRIVIVSDDDDLTIDEAILAHELGHALQDQHFPLDAYERNTKDRNRGKLGVIEGDIYRLELAYRDACEAGEWSEPCVSPEAGPIPDGPPNWGLYFMSIQPYVDGPSFVDGVHGEEHDWEQVDQLYEALPNATLYTINPEKFGEVDLPELEVHDRSTADWDRLTWENTPDYNVIGKAGMSSMLIGQSEEAYRENGDPILEDSAYLTGDPRNPINYDLDETRGWRGDRLYVYSDDNNQTASVWKTAWSDQDSMRSFLSAYEELIAYRGGEPVDGYQHTWTFETTDEYDMAITIYPDGDRLWIVTAPTFDALTDIDQSIELLEEDDVAPTPGGTDDDSNVIDFGPGDGTDVNDEDDDPIPAFGVIGAAVAILVMIYMRHLRLS